jgi:sugar/nucleoside kinase (ribokinase family)
MTKKLDLTCVGILVLDVIAKTINKFPLEGTTEYFDFMKLFPGGCAYNTGVDAKKLGLKVSIQGKIGNDQYGDILLDFLHKEHISTRNIVKGNESTAYSFVMVPESGQRRIYHIPGVNNTYCLDDIYLDSIKNSKVLHIAGSSLMPKLDGAPTVELLKFCKANDTITSMDPVYKTNIADVILPALPYLDIFLPNNDESEHITGLKDPADQLSFYLDKGVGIVGIKVGENGVLISNGKGKYKLGVYHVDVSDTCGAGDAFIAGFIYGILNKWELIACAKFATATAAHCVQSDGATSGIVEAEKILEFISNNEPEGLTIDEIK